MYDCITTIDKLANGQLRSNLRNTPYNAGLQLRFFPLSEKKCKLLFSLICDIV